MKQRKAKSSKKISPFKHLDELRKQLKSTEKGQLRFGHRHVSASRIAQQYYCEMQMEMIEKYGFVESAAVKKGTQAHDEVSAYAEEVEDLTVIERHVASRRSVSLLESLILMKYNKIFVLGVPDCVVFSKNRPEYVVDYKFSKSPFFGSWHHVQTSLYCMMLDRLGFNTQMLHYVIVVAAQACKDCLALEHQRIISQLKKKRAVLKTEQICPECDTGEILVQVNKYDPSVAKKQLDWALGYWREKREAISTKKEWKCRACQYNAKCPTSLVRTTKRKKH